MGEPWGEHSCVGYSEGCVWPEKRDVWNAYMECTHGVHARAQHYKVNKYAPSTAPRRTRRRALSCLEPKRELMVMRDAAEFRCAPIEPQAFLPEIPLAQDKRRFL